jgi:glycine/D-amino acid oxidase-like deaminating enzyme
MGRSGPQSTAASAWDVPQISFWQAQAASDLAADQLPPVTDVLVIGGGLLGSCTAYWLARSGARVTLVEQHAPAFGATCRNGGFHVVGTAEGYAEAIERVGHQAARSVYQITHDCRRLLRQAIADERLDCEYREPGRLNLALSPDQHAAQARSIAALHADGFDGQLLDRAQVQELIKTPLGPEIVGGVYNAADGLLQPVRFVQAMLAAARRHGAQLGCAQVLRIDSEGDRVSVTTSSGVIHAAAAVCAVNAWTGRLLPALAETIRPVRGQVLAYAPMPETFTTGTGAALTPTGEYWHQTPDGSIVLGGCRAAAPDGEVGLLAEGTTGEVQGALEQVFPRLFPRLEGLRVQRRWSGPMAFTRDYMPICDRAPGQPGVWVVGGFCGHGMPFGMRLGQLLAQAALEGSAPPEIEPLRIDRPTLQPSGER